MDYDSWLMEGYDRDYADEDDVCEECGYRKCKCFHEDDPDREPTDAEMDKVADQYEKNIYDPFPNL